MKLIIDYFQRLSYLPSWIISFQNILSCLSTMNKIRSHETYIRIIPCLNYYYSNKIYHSTKIFLFHFHQYSGQDNTASSLNYILVVSFRIKNQWIQNLQNQQNRTKLYLKKQYLFSKNWFDRLDEKLQLSRTFAYKLNKDKFQIQFLKKKKEINKKK